MEDANPLRHDVFDRSSIWANPIFLRWDYPCGFVFNVKKDISGPRETSYRLTDQGEDLMPAFYELMNWGFYYKPKDKRKKKSK